jgi:hypothetical protein
LIEQEPGPRGSPHVPHGPIGPFADGCENDLAGLLDWAANTESSFWRSLPAQLGQLGDWPSRVKYSKWRPQPRHSYSKRGMDYSNAEFIGS